MKKLLSYILVICTAFSFSACAAFKTQDKYTDTVLDLFDTVISVTAYDDSEKSFKEHFDAFYDMLGEYNRLYDIYNSYDGVNNIKSINDAAGKKAVKVDKKIIDLLLFGKEIYEISGGRTNICLGSVLSVWHEYRTRGIDNPPEASLPPEKELQEAAKHTDIDMLIIDKNESTVYLKDSKMSIDIGAIAKGYAAQRVYEYAKSNLWSSAVLNLGGNVIAYGEKPDGTGWNIGIENPDGGDYSQMLEISGESVVTSGDYQRYYEVGGKRYCHIINPDTLMPAEYCKAVTVICDDSGMADALSTTLFNMEPEKAIEMINNTNGAEALITDNNNKKLYSKNFEKYIKL